MCGVGGGGGGLNRPGKKDFMNRTQKASTNLWKLLHFNWQCCYNFSEQMELKYGWGGGGGRHEV